jgi:phage gpG-like protein
MLQITTSMMLVLNSMLTRVATWTEADRILAMKITRTMRASDLCLFNPDCNPDFTPLAYAACDVALSTDFVFTASLIEAIEALCETH